MPCPSAAAPAAPHWHCRCLAAPPCRCLTASLPLAPSDQPRVPVAPCPLLAGLPVCLEQCFRFRLRCCCRHPQLHRCHTTQQPLAPAGPRPHPAPPPAAPPAACTETRAGGRWVGGWEGVLVWRMQPGGRSDSEAVGLGGGVRHLSIPPQLQCINPSTAPPCPALSGCPHPVNPAPQLACGPAPAAPVSAWPH